MASILALCLAIGAVAALITTLVREQRRLRRRIRELDQSVEHLGRLALDLQYELDQERKRRRVIAISGRVPVHEVAMNGRLLVKYNPN